MRSRGISDDGFRRISQKADMTVDDADSILQQAIEKIVEVQHLLDPIKDTQMYDENNLIYSLGDVLPDLDDFIMELEDAKFNMP